MKRKSILIVCILFAKIALCQVSNETHKANIKTIVLESFDEIWSKLNSNNIEKYYSKDFLLLENGEVWNNDSIANYLNNALKREPKPKRINTIDIIEIKIMKKTAWVAYQNYATFFIDNKIVRKAQWLESATLILTESGWKFEMLHSTRIKNEI